jgi:hypothetical protein
MSLSGGSEVSGERKAAIEALQGTRGGSHVITYLTSTRPGAESAMSMDAIRPLFEHLRALPQQPQPKIDLFIHSNGGDGIVPWRLVTLIRSYTDEFTVLVPNRAFSAATLTALGANAVLMHPMGMLGPTDPTVSNIFNPRGPDGDLMGISVEDVASYVALVKEDVGIQHEDELIQAFTALTSQVHPLALGNVKRSTQQSRMMGEKLLRRRNPPDALADHVIEDIVRKLASELFFHGHPINSREAREDVGLEFVQDAPTDVAEAMWELFERYEDEMRLNEPFAPLQEALRVAPLQVPPLNSTPNQQTVRITSPQAFIESAVRCDAYRQEMEVTLVRDPSGQIAGNVSLLGQGWRRER